MFFASPWARGNPGEVVELIEKERRKKKRRTAGFGPYLNSTYHGISGLEREQGKKNTFMVKKKRGGKKKKNYNHRRTPGTESHARCGD